MQRTALRAAADAERWYYKREKIMRTKMWLMLFGVCTLIMSPVLAEENQIFDRWWGHDCNKSQNYYDKEGRQFTLVNNQKDGSLEYDWYLWRIGNLEIGSDYYKGFRWWKKLGSSQQFSHFEYRVEGDTLNLTWIESYIQDEFGTKTPDEPPSLQNKRFGKL